MSIATQDKKYEIIYSKNKTQIDMNDGDNNYFINLKEIVTLKAEPFSYDCVEPRYRDGSRTYIINRKKATLLVRYDATNEKILATFSFIDVEGRIGNDRDITVPIEPEVFAHDVLSNFLSKKNNHILNGRLKCIQNAAESAILQLPNTNVVGISTYADQPPCVFELRDNSDQLVALAQTHCITEDNVFCFKTYSNIQLDKIKEMYCVTPFLKFGMQITNVKYVDKNFSIISFNIMYLSRQVGEQVEFKYADLATDIEEIKTQYSLRTETFAKKSKLMKIGL